MGASLQVNVHLCADNGARGGVGLLRCNQPATSATQGYALEVDMQWQGKLVATVTSPASSSNLTLQIPPEGQVKPWSPDAPNLYDVVVRLTRGSTLTDQVSSYVGFRDLSLAPDPNGFARPLLNGEFVFTHGVLSQGFWPDGVYAAPTDAALENDLLVVKQLGFNSIRMHLKVKILALGCLGIL